MSKPYPNRRRRRPGRRPPHRYSGRFHGPQGYTGPGFRQLCDAFLPFDGGKRRKFFNVLSSTIVLAGGVTGAAIGFWQLGVVGGLVGLGAGITAGGWYAEKRRFYRR
jgi:hypothetical protein